MRTRRQARTFVIVFFALAAAAIVFRIDNWPLTWVPMYAEYVPVEDIPVRVWNLEEVQRGFLAIRQDGGEERINPQRLNIPRTKFIRLYYERIFGLGPPKDYQSHLALSPANRYLRELFDPDPATSVFWDWRILYSLNKSLGREPGQPDFIVEVQAPALEYLFSLRDLNDGGGLTPLQTRRTGLARWRDEWVWRWNNDEI